MGIPFYERLFASFAFVLGAVTGSFLNVCIYRLPLGLSVNNPRRSFCPSCKTQIPWQQNLPLVSWLALRGKCAKCGARISIRYFGVELLTALLFLAVWLKFRPPGPWVLVLPFWILASLLIVATFIDFEHFIIPNEITWGGVIAGLLLSFAMPQMMGSDSNLISLGWSLFGAAVGYATLWLVVELGKKAFGKKRIRFEQEQTFIWTRIEDDAEVAVGDDKSKWSDFFSRESDRLLVRCSSARIRDKEWNDEILHFSFDSVEVSGERFALDQLDEISARITEITIPREAMGLGDVKFIAAIGAFLGWPAVFFTVVSASMLGAVIGLLTIAAGKRAWSAKIPFGPYLALGALIWLFFGWEIVGWYLQKLSPSQVPVAVSIH